MSDKVLFEIKNCSKCPNFSSQRHYTSDSFEMSFDWICKAYGNKVIATVDTFDKEPAIPGWCPLHKQGE